MFKILNVIHKINYSSFNKICEQEINKNGNIRDIVLSLIIENNPDLKVEVLKDDD